MSKKLGQFNYDLTKNINYLYFPLCNYKGMKASITPTLNGDIKIDNHNFFNEPSSQESLNNNILARKIWLIVNEEVWNSTGDTEFQKNNKEKVEVFGEILKHRVVRENNMFSVELETFVPQNDLHMELSKITITNHTSNVLKVKAFVAIPVYGRSSDNIRDHRHVTSLLNKINVTKNTITNKPTMSFDETGHKVNKLSYSVILDKKIKVNKYFPTIDSFQGNSNLNSPDALYNDLKGYKVGSEILGYECLGGFELQEFEVSDSYEFVLGNVITSTEEEMNECTKLINKNSYKKLEKNNLNFWNNELSTLQMKIKNKQYNNFLQWVTLQPILRRIYGCSFMPHHDYGKGGRGWRDLWQDCLALIIMNPQTVEELLFNNFAGIRIDGSNATIIGDNEFIADRNNIARTWMDHGAWPFVTTKLYIDKTGDIDFLFKKQKYFKDSHVCFSKDLDELWNPTLGCILKDIKNNDYEGTVLEHLILQNIVPYYNVGEHNNFRLEGADWNDAIDMASENGESVSFTYLYTSNIFELKELFKKIQSLGISKISLLKEIYELVTSNHEYNDFTSKNKVRDVFFEKVKHNVSGEKIEVDLNELIDLFEEMHKNLSGHLTKNEFIQNEEEGFYRGYYDNEKKSLEYFSNSKAMMTLTPQVFALMSKISSNEQARKVVNTTRKYLFDKKVYGYRLNSDFKMDINNNTIGRVFAFAYGHKENGAMFSHMSVMYANALYKNNFVKEANELLKTLINNLLNINKSKIYPGIPEYVNEDGVGMYHYLTGSASWLILTYVNEVFGITCEYGSLHLMPKLVKDDFIKKQASIKTVVNNKLIEVIYINENGLDYEEYIISKVLIDNKEYINDSKTILIDKELFKEGSIIEVVLSSK